MKKIVLVVSVVVLSLAIGACNRAPSSSTPTASGSPEGVVQFSGDDQITLVATESGKTALDLLVTEHEVDAVRSSEESVTINGINGLQMDGDHYWAFYHNGSMSKTAPDQTVLEVGDVVDFIYEEVGANK